MMFFFPQSCSNVQDTVVRVELKNPKLKLVVDGTALGPIHMEIWGVHVGLLVAR
jgi:uncharacterized membrane protein